MQDLDNTYNYTIIINYNFFMLNSAEHEISTAHKN